MRLLPDVFIYDVARQVFRLCSAHLQPMPLKHNSPCFHVFLHFLTSHSTQHQVIREHHRPGWIIYTIILLKSVCLSMLANCRSQFLLDRLGRCLKLFVSTDSTSSHEFVSQFGLAFFYTRKNTQKLSQRPTLAQVSIE